MVSVVLVSLLLRAVIVVHRFGHLNSVLLLAHLKLVMYEVSVLLAALARFVLYLKDGSFAAKLCL